MDYNEKMRELNSLMELVREAQEWGYDIYIYEMNEFDDVPQLTGYDSWDIARSIHHGDFNPYHEYFEIDVYGHFYSYSEWEMLERLKDIKDELTEFIQSEA